MQERLAALKCSRNHFISEKFETAHRFSNIFFKTVPLCNYTHLPVTVKVLETFLEAILWKSFQLFRRILNYVSSITQASSLQYWFQLREQLQISCSQYRTVWRMLHCCHIILCEEIFDRNWPVSPSQQLLWRRSKLLVFHFSECFLLTTSLRRRRMSVYIYLFTVAIPANYTS